MFIEWEQSLDCDFYSYSLYKSDSENGNYIDLGLILRVFPRAKFILSIRHPNDCVLSCFMQTFNLNDAMANFLDLKDSANLYNLSMRLFEIYNNIFKFS